MSSQAAADVLVTIVGAARRIVEVRQKRRPLEQLDVAARSINAATAYTYEWQTPFLNFGTSAVLKSADGIYISLLPKGDADLTFGYTRDTQTEQTITIAQSAGNTLG